MTVVGRHPVHAGKRHGAVGLDPKVNGTPVENRLVLAACATPSLAVRAAGKVTIKAAVR